MISIIIPVFNVAAYLDECIKSVVCQSYTDWECILVDDGSTDRSGEICEKWAATNSRIRVIHQANGGVSRARNKGVSEAQGEYIVFVDSDDTIGPEHLQYLITAPRADVVVSGIKQEGDNAKGLEFKPNGNKTFSLTPEYIDAFVDLNAKFLLYGPVSKLYKTSVIKEYNILFPVDCHFGEDLQFNLAYLERVKTITQVEEASYYYRRGAMTLSTKPRSNQFHQDYEQWHLLRSFYERHDLWLKPAKQLLYRRLWGIVYDGVFNTQTKNKEVLAIPEIDELKDYQQVFQCSKWIKWCILHRIAFVFR